MQTTLKEIREKRRLTQEEIAQKSKIALRSYQYYETGERVPDVLTAIRIANVLRIKDIRQLFGAGTPRIDETPGGNQANQEKLQD